MNNALGILTLNVTQLSLLLEKPNITSELLCPKEINAFKKGRKIDFLWFCCMIFIPGNRALYFVSVFPIRY